MSGLKNNPLLGTLQPEINDPDGDSYNQLKNKHKKTEWSCLHWIKIIGMVLVVGIAISVVGVYFFHLLAPSQWCWLEVERLDALKSHSLSIVSGLVVGLATTFLHEI